MVQFQLSPNGLLTLTGFQVIAVRGLLVLHIFHKITRIVTAILVANTFFWIESQISEIKLQISEFELQMSVVRILDM